jgi:hypothetical protein
MHHTPGPWRVSSSDDGSVCMVYSSGYEPYKAVRASRAVLRDERVYNADLIAAAPEMLHQLQNLISYLGHLRREVLQPVWDTVPHVDKSGMESEYNALLALAAKAVAEAEGTTL